MTQIRDLPIKSPNTELGNSGSMISQVIVFTNWYTVFTSATLKAGQGHPYIRTHPRPSDKEPICRIRWCWVSCVTSYRVHKLIHSVDLSDLGSRSRWPKYELIRDLPIKSPNTKLGDAGSIFSQVIAFTSRYTVLTSATLKVGQGNPNTNSYRTFQWTAQIPK